jgi:hypothetical protein
VLNSDDFKNNMTRTDRELVIIQHHQLIQSKKSLLLRLLTLNSTELNPEFNADLDDLFEDLSVGKRVQRRIRRGWYNALARRCLQDIDVDPLNVFGDDASQIINNMHKVSFSEIGELRVGNKIYRIRDDDTLGYEEPKL